MVYEEPKAVPDHVKSKVEKYKRLTKATHAAHKRLDRNNNGIPDSLEGGEEVTDEDQSNLKKVGDTSKTAAGGTVEKTSTGIKHTRDPNSYTDDSDSEQKSGKGIKSHAKSQSAAEKKEKAPAQKMSPKSAKTWGMKDSEKFDNRDGAPAKPKKEKAVDEMFGQGVYEAKLKGKQTKLDADKDGDIEADDLAALRAKKKDSKVSEAVKKAKKDYDKDGKIESEKDEVIGSRRKAAGLDEAKAVEVIAENTDLTRVKQFLTRLNG
jgi:hypothetical protein